MNDSTLRQAAATNAQAALAEDIGDGDLSASLAAENSILNGHLFCREKTVLCGVPWFEECFLALDSAAVFEWKNKDGEELQKDALICEVRAQARALLSGERSALNFLQTLSATATVARRWQKMAEPATVVDTRKTLPMLRVAQKYAVRTGGAKNHRLGLFDEILIKENHITAAGGIAAALTTAEKITERIQIEVRNLGQLQEAIAAGAKRILLDNFSLEDLSAAVAIASKQVELEASGGINESNLAAVAATGVNRISIGALTKDIKAADFSFIIE